MDYNILVVIVLSLLLVIWLYTQHTSNSTQSKPSGVTKTVSTDVASIVATKQPLSRVDADVASIVTTDVEPPEPILDQKDILYLVKQFNSFADYAVSEQVLYPQAPPPEPQFTILETYTPLASILSKKYGSKLNNLKLVDMKKQLQFPPHTMSPRLPPVISNYLWYIASDFVSIQTPPSSMAVANEKLLTCMTPVVNKIEPYLKAGSNITITANNIDVVRSFNEGVSQCASTSGIGASMLAPIVSQINNDLKF